MKTTDKILLYDDYCPLCTWYSGLFVKFGLLKPGNRLPFSLADNAILSAIDIEKGKDHIPLFDPGSRSTLYGIDSLLEILGQKMPWVKRAGHIKPVYWFLGRLYNLVSYNRKVIVARHCAPGAFDCSPAFNPFYRILFLLIFLSFNSLMLFPVHDQLLSTLSFFHISGWQLQAGNLVFVGLNCLAALLLNRRMAIEYLGQINMLALICILLLGLLIIITSIVAIPEWLVVFYLGMLTLFIVEEYFRRMKYVGILSFRKYIKVINIVCVLLYLVYVFQ